MDASPLSRLSPELRNQIYEMILVRDTDIKVWKTSQRRQFRRSPALLRTCVEIRREAAPIFYGQNIFLVRAWNRAEVRKMLVSWLRTLGSMRPLLRRIRLLASFFPAAFHDQDLIQRARALSRDKGLEIDHVKLFGRDESPPIQRY